jgi:hypothetical protein
MGQNPGQPAFDVSVFNMGDVESGPIRALQDIQWRSCQKYGCPIESVSGCYDCRSELSSITPHDRMVTIPELNELRRHVARVE